jgi:hypothetical protein
VILILPIPSSLDLWEFSFGCPGYGTFSHLLSPPHLEEVQLKSLNNVKAGIFLADQITGIMHE